jgi:peptidoglycan hydrolase-like protein with peptidoglycan-binding domain
MAKSQLHTRVPKNTEQAIKAYQREHDIEAESEAARQLIEAGVEAQADDTPGERLAETGTAISGVGGLVAALGAFTGSTVGLSLVVPFLGSAFVFTLLWASIRALGGGALR